MPHRKEQLINNEIYHVVIRGIDDNLIFKDTDDYYRSIFSIYEFNSTKPITIRERRKIRFRLKQSDRERVSDAASVVDVRDKLVDALAFCFMPNHIHLLLRQIKNDGVTKFMRKVGAGYGGYFNKKYGRKGYVFQNRFRSVHIKNDDQLKTVFTYIHTNPISLIEPGWKESGIRNPEEVLKFLESFKWSSYPDYFNKKNFPSVTERDFILEIMGGEQGCRDFVENWVRHKAEISQSGEITPE